MKTMEKAAPDNPVVIIDRCGCLFLKSYLEKSVRGQFSTKVLHWFKGGGEVSRCVVNR